MAMTGHFWLLRPSARVGKDEQGGDCKRCGDPKFVLDQFPFKTFFTDAPKDAATGNLWRMICVGRTDACDTYEFCQGALKSAVVELLKGAGEPLELPREGRQGGGDGDVRTQRSKRYDFLGAGFQVRQSRDGGEALKFADIRAFSDDAANTRSGRLRLRKGCAHWRHHRFCAGKRKICGSKYCNMDWSLFAQVLSAWVFRTLNSTRKAERDPSSRRCIDGDTASGTCRAQPGAQHSPTQVQLPVVVDINPDAVYGGNYADAVF